MSIFVSKESKERPQAIGLDWPYRFLLAGDVLLLRWVSMATHHGSVSDMTPVSYVLSAIWVMGHLVLWPAIAVWLIRREENLSSFLGKEGR